MVAWRCTSQAIRSCCDESQMKLIDVMSDEGVSGSNGLDARVGLALSATSGLQRVKRLHAPPWPGRTLDRLAQLKTAECG